MTFRRGGGVRRFVDGTGYEATKSEKAVEK